MTFLALALAACSPAMDWRQVRPDDWGVAVALPCRPSRQERLVTLAGPPVTMTLLACSVDDQVFAFSSADLIDPSRVEPALNALLVSAQANIQAAVLADSPAQVQGMTPHPGARRRKLEGHAPDGQKVNEQLLVFARGLRIYQVTLMGPRLDDAVAKQLFDGIEVNP